MSSQVLNLSNFGEDEIESTPTFGVLEEQVLQALIRFAGQLKRFNIETVVTTDSALAKLPFIENFKKRSIVNYYNELSGIMMAIESNAETEQNLEKNILLQVLEKFGYFADDEFLKTIESNDLIEVYGPDMIQIYRTMNFYKVTSYSLMDLTINEWFVLWERPKLVSTLMSEYISQVTTSYIPVTPFKIPRHVLRETYNSGTTEPFVPRATIVDFKFIGSLKDSNFSSPKGLICSSKGESIAFGNEALNIQFV